MTNLNDLHKSLSILLGELEQQVTFRPQQLFVVGCSTSEVIGELIGTAGAMDVATVIYEELQKFAERHELYLAFQGCEHINRALTLEYTAAEKYRLEPVHVVPVKTAGGSMSAYAHTQMRQPVVVENVQAHAGIDIGQTLIGMHLKAVAVPIRTSVKTLGEAVVTVATTRPKLIGGVRAQYE
ncbi:TIGR01440 family protein [Metasolibacillus meyeri]|uniref:TIGR01440 family protein n=1 Tax=Metasolibacillus meyeri TaxID=1071052 RepID=UPI000D324155|nr:TIGR01440 family protein [Metasolibacillus meyeri]